MKRILTVATLVVVVGLFFIIAFEIGFRGANGSAEYDTKDNHFRIEEPTSQEP